MIQRALAGEPVRAIQGAGGEYGHLDDVLRAFLLAPGHPQAGGEVFNLAGSHTYSDLQLARYIVQLTGSRSPVQLVEDPTQRMISLSVDKLRRRLGYEFRKGEFLTGLIQRCLSR